MPTDSSMVLRIFYRMLKARLFEQEAAQLKEQGLIGDELSLALGQEATAGAVCALSADDVVFAGHRNFTIAVACDISLTSLLAELAGLPEGLCGGKSGGASFADNSVNFYGATALRGGSFAPAAGAALSLKLQHKNNCVACFAGDGACASGGFYEALNTSALLRLPIIFFIENNGYAASVKTEKIHNVKDIAQRAAGYEIPGLVVDGNDAISVYETMKKAAEYARQDGPILIESKTFRLAGHTYADEQAYKTEEETAKWQQYDPIKNISDYMLSASMGTAEDLLMMRRAIEQEVAGARGNLMKMIEASEANKRTEESEE